MSNGITVIKTGGNELDDPVWADALAAGIAGLPGRVVLVHGGGKEVTDVQRALGAEPEWRDGLRVTTPEALRAARMVLSGLVNKRLVAALARAGVEAVGVSGEDGRLLTAEAAPCGTLGRTGTVRDVRTRLLHALLTAGMLPVVSPVSRSTDGEPLNVNADDAAAAIAAALRAERFLLVSNVPGVMWTDAVLDEVDVAEVEELVRSGVATGGMGPKLRAAARAAAAGIGDVRIGGLEMLGDPRAGTRLTAPRPYALAI